MEHGPMNMCATCGGSGVIIFDGHPSGCNDCERGRTFAQKGRESRERARQQLPPGGDVLIAQARREAAGLPLGQLGDDPDPAPVRAVLDTDRRALDQALDDLAQARGVARRAVALLTSGDDASEFLDTAPEWVLPGPAAPPMRLASVPASPLVPPEF